MKPVCGKKALAACNRRRLMKTRVLGIAVAAWLAAGAPELVLTGSVLARVGLPAPLLTPEQAALFTLTAV